MFTERTSVGLDVHALSVRAAGLDTMTGQFVRGDVDSRARPCPGLGAASAGTGRGGL